MCLATGHGPWESSDWDPNDVAAISRVFTIVLVCACAGQGGGAAEPDSDMLAAELQAEIQKAQPDRYLLLLRACIDNAVKYAAEAKAAPEDNPFHKLLVGFVAQDQPASLRIAAVKAITSTVPGGTSYLDGVKMLFPLLGTEPERFRIAVRDGLLAAIDVAPELVPLLESLVTGAEASRLQIEDAAYILWARDPAKAIDRLIEGAAVREKVGRECAVYYCVLTDYLHHREPNAELWETYWRDNRAGHPALRETHFVRARVVEEVTALWDECCQALRNSANEEGSVAGHWQVARRGIDSPWAAVRERACKEIGLLAAKASNDPKKRALLAAQVPVLLDVLGAGGVQRYEPLAVRMEALRALQALRPVAVGDRSIAKFLGDVFTKTSHERAFRVGALRVAGELGMDLLRGPICAIVLNDTGDTGLDVLAEALGALGKIGLQADDRDAESSDKLIAACIALYAREENRTGEEAEVFRQALVRTLGKVGGQTSRAGDVKDFLRKLLEKTLEKNPALAVFVLNAFGELSDKDLLVDLSTVIAQRTKLSPNVVQAAVNAVWLVGSSGTPEALDRAAGVCATHIESGDAVLTEVLTQKLVFLGRGSIAKAAAVAAELVRQKRFKSAVEILGGDDIAKLRQAALVDGTEQDLEGLWTVERVYMAGLEALELFDACLAAAQRLEMSKRAAELGRIAGTDILRLQVDRVKSKKLFCAAVAAGKPAEIVASFKALVKLDPSLYTWALGKISESSAAVQVNELLQKDPELPAALREKLTPPKK